MEEAPDGKITKWRSCSPKPSSTTSNPDTLNRDMTETALNRHRKGEKSRLIPTSAFSF